MKSVEKPKITYIGESSEANRDRLTLAEMGNLLAAIGNSESKVITLLSMYDDSIYTSGDLRQRVNGLQGNQGWKMSRRNMQAYCEKSLSPIGLVALEATNPDGTVFGWSKTNYGKIIGDSLGGHLLSVSERHPNYSLGQILGSTASNSKIIEAHSSTDEVIDYKKRSPLTRLQILWVLSTSELPITDTDLYQQLGGEETVGNITAHLKDLGRLGIISYSSRETNNSIVFYKTTEKHTKNDLDENKSLLQGNLTGFQKKVLEVVKTTTDWFSVAELNDKFCDIHTQRNREYTLTKVRAALELLRNNGYLDRNKPPKFTSSEINLTTEQRELVVDLIDTIYRFEINEPGFRREGTLLGQAIINDQNRISALMLKAKDKSPNANRHSKSETNNILVAIVRDNPDTKTSDICTILKSKYGVVLKPTTLTFYLRELAKTKRIKISQKRGSIFWVVN